MSDPPYDQRIANLAAAVDQCVKLGGVIIDTKPKAGFAPPPPPPPPLRVEREP